MERELGKRAVPFEKAIPSEQKSVDLEHLSHWLDKYDGKYAVGACSCRRSRRVRDEGCGHLEEDMCITVGDMATYAIETNKARPATREEVMEILQKAYADAKRILTENRGLLDEISEFLLVKETITGDELMAYVNADKNALPAAEKTEE